MKKAFLFLPVILFLVTGCQETEKINAKVDSNLFPKALASVWEGYFSQIHWVVKFTPDGKVEYAKLPFVGDFVGPNAEVTFPMQGDNNTMVVKTGDFKVDYNRDGTLGVSFEVIHIDAMIPSGRMEMKGTEYLIGEVDLEKGIWNATWFTDGNYWLTPLGDERTMMPEDEELSGNPIVLRRMVRKDSLKIEN